MISVIYIWISVMIIQLAVATPYSRQQIMLATAEGWIDCFGPIFLQNVFFICLRKPQKKWGHFLWVFSPQIMDDKLDPWCFLGGFQELRINPHFLKTSCICFCICFQLADQQIRHLSSGKSFQKMRINPQFLKTNPKSDQSLKKMPPWRPKNYFLEPK